MRYIWTLLIVAVLSTIAFAEIPSVQEAKKQTDAYVRKLLENNIYNAAREGKYYATFYGTKNILDPLAKELIEKGYGVDKRYDKGEPYIVISWWY